MSVAIMHQQCPSSSLQQHYADLQQQHAAVQAAARAHGAQQRQQAIRAAAHSRGSKSAIMRATVLSGAAHAAAASAGAAAAPAMAAMVLADVADGELGKRLQSRLATLGIGANMVKVEVRANEASATAAGAVPAAASAAAAAASPRSFTLTLTGRIQLALGSLFNMLIAHFLKQHVQITRVERRITFQLPAGQSATAVDEEDSPCFDSPPTLQLKIKHLAKLMASSAHTVVYTGDHLCQTASSSPAAAATSPALEDLSGPHPPALLAAWARNGTIQHIINENTDGMFNPTPRDARTAAKRAAAAAAAAMSDDDEAHSSSDDDSSVSDAAGAAPTLLGPEHLSELYGNKFVEVCSTGCGHPGAPGNATTFLRDFEVQRMGLVAPLRVGGAPALPHASSNDSHLTGRSCSYCNGALRDTLVGWNEPLPRALLHRCISMASQADLSLVLGSKLRVSPVADLPSLAASSSSGSASGATLVIVQASTTAKDVACLEAGGVLIRATPGVVLAKLDAELKRLQQKAILATTGTAAMPAIIRKSSPSLSPAVGGVAPTTLATAHPARAVMAMRPGSTQLASSIVKRDLKRRASSVQAASASVLSLFTQRRGAPPNRGPGGAGLVRLDMVRSATAGASLLSMDAAAAARVAGSMSRSAALPPFPRLDDDDDEQEAASVCRAGAMMPPRSHSEERHSSLRMRECAMGRPSSISSTSGALPPRTLDSGTSLLSMLQHLPPTTPMPPTPLPDVLCTPNYYRSLSPPPDMLGAFATPAPPPLPAAQVDELAMH